MKKFLNSTLGVLVLLLMGWSALAFEVNPELEQFERSLESRLQEQLRTVFGNETRLAVTVHGQAAKPVQPNQKPVSKIDVDKGAYAPFPLDLNADSAVEDAKTEGLKIAQLDIGLQVPDDLDEKAIEDAKSVLKNSIKAYYVPRISIVKFPAVKRVLTSGEENPILKKVLPHLGILGAALLLSFAILVIGLALKSSVRAIAEGLRVQAATNSNVTLTGKGMDIGGSMEIKNGSSTAGALRESEGLGVSPAVSLEAYGRNINLIQQLLKDDPMLIAQNLRDSESDWMGIRSLLPCLTTEDQENLKKCLGPARLSRLGSVSASHADSPGWLREFVERMMLKKVQGGNKVESVLGPENSIAFTMAEPISLVDAAKALNNRAAWRIAMNFLPEDHADELLGALEQSQWRLLASGASVTSEEISEAATQMLATLKQAPQANLGEKERVEYIRDALLGPVVRMVSAKEPGQDVAFLEGLAGEAPELADMVMKKVWTVNQLDLVPDTALFQAVRELSYEEKVLLIIALPERHAERIKAGLPEGNVRTIVLAQIPVIQNRNQAADKRSAVEVARRFLENLRRQSEAKKFELLDPTGITTMKEAA